MRAVFRASLAAAVAALLIDATPAFGSELKLERVTMLMRHGIRPPTKAQPIPAEYSPRAWPQWPVGPGLLTPRGAKGAALIAAADRANFADRGLLPAGACPAAGQVSITASKVPRAIATAEAWASGFAPGCGLNVTYPEKDQPDALFHPLQEQPEWFDGRAAYQNALEQDPRGGVMGEARRLTGPMRQMARILSCVPPVCDLEHEASSLIEKPHDRPTLHGPLDVAATASETFLLEYLENMPIDEVGWGQVSRTEFERLLVFTAVKFHYEDRPPVIARATAGPLARAIVNALTAADGPPVTLLAGHDTNIADLGGLLDLHWRVPGYPRDTVPPGSALGFETLSDPAGKHYVRAFYRSQSMRQLRNLEPLGSANPPYFFYIDIPGCGRAIDPRGCGLETFKTLVEARL
jgi:4-phytase/acid phosphatase